MISLRRMNHNVHGGSCRASGRQANGPGSASDQSNFTFERIDIGPIKTLCDICKCK